MKNYKLILQSLLFLSCVLTSLIYANDNTVVFVTLGEMSFVRDDSLYGNQTLKVPEINQNVMDNGGVLAFIERPANDDRPQRWSQLPQLTLAWDTPTYMYLSHGLGIVRLSYQSSKSITDAVEYTKGKRLKLVISE
jgi:hypothetical protein|tara:strand:+ start:1505 stop:1912 length:408 start_codon:yes stop_codon:yes gene_type:complete